LLAGPGTGKTRTLTQRVVALLTEHNLPGDEILVLTFTRVAANQLREEVRRAVGPHRQLPNISTLHSFALRQLLRNARQIQSLHQPLRIADDWEERHIIMEDLKEDLAAHLLRVLPDVSRPVEKIRRLFNQLSADWETLRIDQDEGSRMCRDGPFLGAWREHARLLGYTLRTQLVYELKRAMEIVPDFDLESQFSHVMIDEYQDLNACDLSVVDHLSSHDVELFVAGDDDQSIYGFRFADPTGIRIFPHKYSARRFDLEICYRCDREILQLATFVASLDYRSYPKVTRPRDDAQDGQVRLLRFSDQVREAEWVARVCADMLASNPELTVLVLTRSDRNRVISTPLTSQLDLAGVPTTIETGESFLDQKEPRHVLTYLRLLANPNDDLAWYAALLQERGIGRTRLSSLREHCRAHGLRLQQAIVPLGRGDIEISGARRLSVAVQGVADRVRSCRCPGSSLPEEIQAVVGALEFDEAKSVEMTKWFLRAAEEGGIEKLSSFVASLSATVSQGEQQISPGCVNMLTMHRAKGLSADVVVILGAEEEFLPGRNIGERAEDERRLLYVSISRARHHLFMTHCRERVGAQRYTGSRSGVRRRHLCPFLRDAGVPVEEIV
ncbi:MAG TPA: ATP-dependent helicase, partial [Acidobacteriota bacterium]|nr:ATP-dependent helicase [Acidobacteriota bacterium]